MAETSGFSTDLPQSAYLSLSIRRAISAAQQRSHRYVTLEHLLLALLDDPDALRLLEAVSADIPAIRMSVADTVNRNLATLYTPGQFDLRASYKVERVLQTASDDANRLGCAEVDAAFVLAGLSRESDNPAADILKRNRFAYSSAMTWIYANRGVSMARRPAAPARAEPQPAPAAPVPPPAPEPALAPAGFGEASFEAAAPHEPEPLDEELVDIEEEDDSELELEILDHDEPEPAPAPRPAPAKPLERLPEIIARTAPPPPPAPSPVRSPAATAPASARIGATTAATARVQPAPVPAKAPPAPMPETAAEESYRQDRWASDAAPPIAPAPPNLAPRRREMNGAHEPAKPAPAAAAPSPRRAPEPKVPSASRLDEMRVRNTAPGAEHSRAPLPAPVPPPSERKTRRNGNGNGKPAAPQQAKAPAPAPAAPAPDKQKGRQRRPARPGETLIGKLVENIPRRMRAAVPERIEVRISREETHTLARGMEGGGQPVRHDVMVTQTMSVALRAPDGGFTIEPLSPETQWIFEKPAAGEDAEMYGRWRWVVTPHERGQHRLQVVVAARSIDHSGLVGDTALPDQVITVRVRINYLRAFGRALQWAILMVIGGVLTEAALMGMKIFTGGGD